MARLDEEGPDARASASPSNDDNRVLRHGSTAEGLNPCSPYYFAVRVVDDVGNDAPLATAMVVTRCSGSMELTCE